MLVTCNIYKDWTGVSWPVWHSKYLLAVESFPTWLEAHAWATDFLMFERSIHLKQVNHTLAAFMVADGSVEGGAGSAIAIALNNAEPPFPREADNPLPWNYHLRARKFPAVGRNSSQMWRGCLNEADVRRDESGRVGLITRDVFTEVMNANGFQRPGSVLAGWQIDRSGGRFPIIGSDPVQSVWCGGVSLLNGARRAEASKISAGVQLYREIHGYTLEYTRRLREYYYEWYTLGIPDYYPASIQLIALAAISSCSAAAEKVDQFSKDYDTATPGDQAPSYRYYGTEGSEAGAASLLKDKATLAQMNVLAEVPFPFAGENYFHLDQMQRMWDAIEPLNSYLAALSFYDYQNPRQGTEDTPRAGGYTPLAPELPPPS